MQLLPGKMKKIKLDYLWSKI